MAVMGNSRKQHSLLKCCTVMLISGFIIVLISGPCPAVQQGQETFASPHEAVKALVGALRAADAEALTAIFGPDSSDLVSSGDPIADRTVRAEFIRLYTQKNKLEDADANQAVLYVGEKEWPFPIPIVKEDGAWRFDTDAGREEVLARRIGRNELSVVQICLAYVDAQREYALKDRDRGGLMEYAQKVRSEPDKKDGLYWEVSEGDEQSPLGPLIAAAQEEGYADRQAGDKPAPYHGYYYKILKAQGEHAQGGVFDYVVKGKMIGGFALVAYPAQYGASGIMTFTVNHDGVVYQKDLGEDTETAAPAIKIFNPDSTWEKVSEDASRVQP